MSVLLGRQKSEIVHEVFVNLILGSQQSKASFAVSRMSWSMNCPHCISMWELVLLSWSAEAGSCSSPALTARGEGSVDAYPDLGD